MEKKQKAKYIISDTLSAMLAWAALFLFRKLALEHTGFSDVADVYNDANFWLGLVLVPLGWLCLYTIQGTYRNVLRRARLTELLDTLLASLIGVVVIFFVHFTFTYIPRLIITTHTVNAVHTRRLGFPTVMIGSGPRALQTYTDLESQETYSGNLFVGYIDVNAQAIKQSDAQAISQIMPCLGTLSDMRAIVNEHHIEEAIVALEPDEKERLSDILLAINSCGDIIIKITPDARDIAVGSIHQRSIFHSPFIVINNRLMPEWQYSLKRIADILISLFALILLTPVYLVTAIIVKATSPGPVFYAQERIGHLGKPFKMHKFRSMYVDAEDAGPSLSKDDDPRITPFGRFMRKVRLDEIPQFYNVLRGTMSLVGPRPERQYYIDQIVQRAPEYMLLQRVKPGITSWGQVKYGYASNVDQMVERLRYDLLYLDNMSLTTDLKILLYTVIIIFQGRGK